MAALLLVEHLSKSYPCGTRIVEDAAITLEGGQIVGLSGKSGQGKSTIARILCGLLPADSGNAMLEGKLLFRAEQYDTRHRPAIQLIPQQPFAALDRCQTILDAVAEPLRCHRQASRAEAVQQAADLLAATGLSADLHRRKPFQLSGGQCQRAVVARALAVSPRLILADEATSALDIPTGRQVMGLLQDWVTHSGGGLLLISHDTRMLAAVCHRQYHLENTTLKEITYAENAT